jgi:hypothetical protein
MSSSSSSQQPTFTSIRKVLIANRGEIACRIIRTCKQLGLVSISIYTPADRTSAHVRLADEAWLLPGPDQSAYIEEDAVLEIARKSGAHAVIPGYGECAIVNFIDARLPIRERRLCRTRSCCWVDLGWSIRRGNPQVWTKAYREGAGGPVRGEYFFSFKGDKLIHRCRSSRGRTCSRRRKTP